MYCDPSGNAWETVFDIISLCASFSEALEDPTDGWLWVGVAADAVDLIPFVTGVGEITRAIRIADNVFDTVDTAYDTRRAANTTGKILETTSTSNRTTRKITQKGWNVGDDISVPTKYGTDPSWSTAKQRYWKNEEYYGPSQYMDTSKYSADSMDRMKKGLAPQILGKDGKYYSMELHHCNVPRRDGGKHTYMNLMAVSPWKHAEIDEFRHFSFKVK